MKSWLRFFSCSLGQLLTWLAGSFAVQKAFNFMKLHLSIFGLISRVSGVQFRKSLHLTYKLKYTPYHFFYNIFRGLDFMLRILAHLEFCFVQDWGSKDLVLFFCMFKSRSSAIIHWRYYLFFNAFLFFFGVFVKDHIAIVTCYFIWVLYSTILIYVAVFVPLSWSFYYSVSEYYLR